MVRYRSYVARLALCLSALASAGQVAAQPNWENGWRGQWIADSQAGPKDAGVFHFRREFDLSAKPATFPIRVSADNRYRLFVNGVEVSSGPARGDLLNWRYERVDIAPHLRPGRNILTATVWNFGELRPSAQFSFRTAFLVQGETAEQAVVDTGPAWQVLRDDAYSFSQISPEDSGGYYVAGPSETIDAAKYPWGWDGQGGATLSWRAAKPVGGAFNKGNPPFGLAEGWQLVPRSIPPMEEKLMRFATVRRAEGIRANDAFLKGTGDLVIPARSKVTLLIDQGQLTMGHPVLRTSGGAGANAELVYAEALFDAKGAKGNRNDIAGKTIRGLRDHIRFDGSDNREFRPLWLRAFRYVQLEVQTGDQPLRIHDFHSIFTAYPFVQRASFDSDVPWLKGIWNLDWNALRLSAFETFWDTPYYEQLQYVGDTRIESLLSVYLTGDDRLMRNAIEQIGSAHTPEGITLSSYPSWRPQRIPSFSLWWVAMLHDHWMLRGDRGFVGSFLPAMRSVIGWHQQYIDQTGMLGAMPWWNFLDWADGYKQGVPPGAADGHATAFTLQYAMVLRQAADIEDAIGSKSQATEDRALADKLVASAQAKSWDAQKGLFTDAPENKVFSQQTNTLALLANAVPEAQRADVMKRILTDRSLIQASFYFRFYVDEAMQQTGQMTSYLDSLDLWREMLRNGMTSTAETPEPTRSDSHAWSAHPNYHLLASVLGIRPTSPGFRSVQIQPALGSMRRAAAQMPLPQGTMSVKFQKKGVSGVDGEVSLPSGISGELRWGGTSIPLKNGKSKISCKVTCTIS